MPSRRSFLAAAGATSLLPALDALATVAADPASEYGFSPGLVYLNTSSTGPTPRAVLDRTLAAWTELETNPVAETYFRDGVLGWAEQARDKAAAFLGCSSAELLLTRSVSESMNTVAQSLLLKPGDRVLTTDQEHAGGSDGWRYLAERSGIVIDQVPILATDNDPQAIVDRFAAAIRPTTRVISFSHILYTTGLRMPVRELSLLARSRNLLSVVDGAQAVGAAPVDVKSLACHAYAANAHKFLMGPKGVGMLYISADAADRLMPVQWFGGKGIVADSTGIAPLPLHVGLGTAIDLATARGIANIERHNLALRDRAYRSLSQIAGLKMMSLASNPITSHLLSFALPSSTDNRALQQTLTRKHQVVVKVIDRSHFNGLRISPHIFNTEAHIDAFVAALKTEMAA